MILQMERLKLAISKARDDAHQLRQEQARQATRGESVPLAADAPAAAQAHGQPGHKRSPKAVALPLLAGLAALTAFWVLRADPGSVPQSTSMLAEAAPAPHGEVAVPTQPSQQAVAGVASPSNGAPASLGVEVEAAVETWRQAWSARDMKAYLDAYSESFTPQTGTSRKDWVASRHRNVGARKSIDVQIKDIQVLALGERRARTRFLQDYNSGSSREMGRLKTLDWVRESDGRWRIEGEWLGEPPAVASAEKG